MARVDQAPAEAPARVVPPRRERAVLLALWLSVFASSSQLVIVAPILPRLGEALAIPVALQGTLVTAFAIAMAIFGVLVGPVSDRVGRRAVLLVGTAAMTLALASHSLAFDYVTIMAARVAAGVAAGVLTGAAVACIADCFPYERRGWATGWVMTGVAAGQLLGIPAGILAAARFGFDAPFVLFAVVMAGACVLVHAVVPRPPRARAEGRLTLRAGIGTYVALLRRRDVVVAAAAQAAMFVGVWSFLIDFPTWAETQLHMAPAQVAGLFVVGGLASVVAGPAAGRLSDRIGRRPLVLLSCLGTAGLLVLALLGPHARWAAHVLFFAVMGLFAIRMPPFQALLTALVPEGQRASLVSLVLACGQLGGGLGAALGGFIYASVGFSGCMLAAAAAACVAGLVVVGLPEPAARRAER